MSEITSNFLIQNLHAQTAQMRQKKPLIHHITNFVTIYPCARITSFIGATPIMAFSADESADITAGSDALVINTGTLNDEFRASIPKSTAYANQHQIPVVLDPVGAKVSSYRSDFIRSLLQNFHFTVIRCNASELLSLDGFASTSRGIDSTCTSADIPAIAKDVAKRYRCVVACTGATDIIQDCSRTLFLNRGTPKLSKLVGTGCMVNSLIASYLTVTSDPLQAAAYGILAMCLSGEQAEKRLQHESDLGSFESYLMDAISAL